MEKVRMTLEGLDGNAFNLLGHFRRAAKRQEWGEQEITAVTEEATRGDYTHLLAVLMEHTEDLLFPANDPEPAAR